MTKMVTSSSSVVVVMSAVLLIAASVMEVEGLTKHKNQKQEPAAAANAAGNNAAASEDSATMADSIFGEGASEASEDPFFEPKTGDYLDDSSDPLSVALAASENTTASESEASESETNNAENADAEAEKAEEEAAEEEATEEEQAEAVEAETTVVNSTTCVTREDERASSWFASTAPAGTACIFGVDPRDEGEHCIMETEYGTFGWCYTDPSKTVWGSCSESCPLVGHAKILGGKVDRINSKLQEINVLLGGNDTNGTNATNATTGEEAAGANAAAGADPAALAAPLDPAAAPAEPAKDGAAAAPAADAAAAAAPGKEAAPAAPGAASSVLMQQNRGRNVWSHHGSVLTPPNRRKDRHRKIMKWAKHHSRRN